MFRREDLDPTRSFDWRFFSGDFDLFGDGSIVILHMPGHTPATRSVLVRLANHTFLLAIDTAHLRSGYVEREADAVGLEHAPVGPIDPPAEEAGGEPSGDALDLARSRRLGGLSARARILRLASIEPVQNELRNLEPASNAQRLLQSRALRVSGDIAEGHWLLTESTEEGLLGPFLLIVVFWLGLLFGTFCLLAPPNTTVLATLVIGAVSVAGALFLIVDMDHPDLLESTARMLHCAWRCPSLGRL